MIDPRLPSKLSTLAEIWETLKVIPGAIRAISHLVIGAARTGEAALDVETAKFQRIAQAIRNETNAKKLISEAIAPIAAANAAQDSAIVKRALTHWTADLSRKQINREAVARLTIEQFSSEVPPRDSDGPEEDWLNIFSRFAEDASSEKIRETWARILAGEIRRPGTFSLKTLHFLSLIDHKLAQDIRTVSGYVFNNDLIPTIGPFNKGELYTKLLRLSEAGFCSLGSAKYYTISSSGFAVFTVGNVSSPVSPQGRDIKIFQALGDPGREIKIHGAILTATGVELMGIIDSEPCVETMNALIEAFGKELNLQILPLRMG